MAKPYKLPIILKKDKFVDNKSPLLKNVKFLSSQSLFREDVIYESSNGDFLRGEFHKVTIVNRYNILTNTTPKLLTVAKCETHDGYVIEKTSDTITKLIGQSNYDLLFSTLWSVISQELKIRGILSLLTVSKKTNETSCQTANISDLIKLDIEIPAKEDIAVQTEENIFEFFKKKSPRKRIKRQHMTPYVVKDTTAYDKKADLNLKRVVINPEDYKETVISPVTSEDSDELKVDESRCVDDKLPVIQGKIFDENSVDSIGNCSIKSIDMPGLLTNPYPILNNVDKFTANIPQYPIHMLDHTVIYVPTKPENPYHVASKENLQHLKPNERKKLLFHQAYLDWKCCLDTDEDGNRPLHIAVLNNDLELLRRQCLVLKIRKESVDISENLTALQMSITLDHPRCTEMLLKHGANPLLTNDEHKTALHLSAEAGPEHLKAVVNCCRANARKFLLEDKELWEPRFENRSDMELGKHLLEHMSTMYDIQGYTPLMLASKLGKAENVALLLESAPSSVNIKTPNSGNTALYLVVESACIDAAERGNKSKVSDNFSKTIELLVENGADPSIDNHSGSNINVLLTEFSIGELSMLIANKLTTVKFGEIPSGNFDSYMLVINEDGVVNKELIKEPIVKAKTGKGKKTVVAKEVVLSRPKAKKGVKTNITNSDKPVILENVRIDPENKIEIEIFTPADVKTDRKKPVIVDNIRVSDLKGMKIKMEPSSPKKVKEVTGDTCFMNNYKNFIKNSIPTQANCIIKGESPIKKIFHQFIKSSNQSDRIKIIKNELIEDPLKMNLTIKEDFKVQPKDVPSKRKIATTPGTSKKQKISITNK